MSNREDIADALREVLHDDSPHGWVLLSRVPIICNDIKWIKKAIFAILGGIGALALLYLTK